MLKHISLSILALLSLMWGCQNTEEAPWLELPKVETTAVSNIGTTSFAYQCNLLDEGSGGITACGIVYGTNANPTLEKDKFTNILTQDETERGNPALHWVNNLNINKKYYIRAYATNPAGTAYGSVREVYLQRSVEGLKITPESISLQEEETVNLGLAFTPESPQNTKVSWSSQQPEVASVDAQGKVTAHKVGEATITAISEDRNIRASCTVTVTQKIIHVTGVHLMPELVLRVGESKALEYSLQPEAPTDPTVTWTSSNKDVATVSNGIVTAIAEGEATITITTRDGNHTAKCVLTIIPRRIAVEGIRLDVNSKTIYIGTAFQLHAILRPTHADNKNVTWHSSHPTIASVDNTGLVKALKAGKTTISVTTEDGGHKAYCQVEVKAIDNKESPKFIEIKKIIEELSAELAQTAKAIDKAKKDNDTDVLDTEYGNLNGYYKGRYNTIVSLMQQHQQEMLPAEMQHLVTSMEKIKALMLELMAKTNY